MHFIPETSTKECNIIIGYSNGLIVVYNVYSDKCLRFLNFDPKTG